MKLKAFQFVAGIYAVLLLCTSPVTAQPNLLVNGDFENTTGWQPAGGDYTTAPIGWQATTTQPNAASQQSGANAIGGSGTSASFLRNAASGVPDSTSGRLGQRVAEQSGPVYEWAWDFASEDPGGPADRSISFAIYHGPMTNGITTLIMRLADDFDDGIGDWQVFTNGLWDTIVPDAVIFDDDVSVTPLVHHFSMKIDSTAEIPFYDLRITDSNGMVHEALNVSKFNGTSTGPINEGGKRIEWNNQLSKLNTDWLIDNVSLKTLVDFPSLDGDFDGDGDVDGRDFLIWQRGETTPPLDPSLLSDWQTHYGTPLMAEITAVPEPGTCILFGSALLVSQFRRSRNIGA